jgi:hypothetical protein
VGRIAVAALLLLAAGWCAGPAQAGVIGGQGWRGASSVFDGRCKYGNTGLRGFLEIAIPPPSVTGANVRRRQRGERSLARYAVWLLDANTGTTLLVSNWSAWIRVREGTTGTWTGNTAFTADWRGNYRLELRIEWWRSNRRIGWRAHSVDRYQFFDQYNTGPYGPIGTCHHFQVEL